MPNVDIALTPDEMALLGTTNPTADQLGEVLSEALAERLMRRTSPPEGVERRRRLRSVSAEFVATTGDLSVHFNRRDFACHCGCGFGLGEGEVSAELLTVLETLRAHFDSPVLIVEGCRCRHYNRVIGASPNSQHLTGRAADVRVIGATPAAVANWLERRYPAHYGIGRYDKWTHVDVGPQRRRWVGQ